MVEVANVIFDDDKCRKFTPFPFLPLLLSQVPFSNPSLRDDGQKSVIEEIKRIPQTMKFDFGKTTNGHLACERLRKKFEHHQISSCQDEMKRNDPISVAKDSSITYV